MSNVEAEATLNPALQIEVSYNTVLLVEASIPPGNDFDFTFLGAQGPPGAQGPIGPPGATGPPGPTGADSTVPGPAGPQGIQGVPGPQGPQGIQGDTGTAGATGSQGPPGTTGATGSQGPQGVKGDTGNTGPQGDTGPQGEPGPQGNPGATGSQGPVGPGVVAGGTTDQILAKASAVDYATKWINAPTGGGAGEDFLVERSKGAGLVANGTAILENNYNFSWATYVPTDRPTGTSGSFLSPTGTGQTRYNDEFIPVDVYKKYVLSLWCRETNPAAISPTTYTGIAAYDIDDLAISAYNTMYIANTLTTLAADLIPGATTIQLTSGANWNNAGVNYQRSLIFWNYVDGSGYAWPPSTYSRNTYVSDIWLAGGISGNVVTLRVPWAGPTISAGTQLSNGTSGSAFMYGPWANQATPLTWTFGTVVNNPFGGGVQTGGTLPIYLFPQGTTKIKIVLLPNRVTNSQTAYAGISLEEYGHTHLDVSSGLVPSTRSIATTAPLTGGGDLSANRTLAVSAATATAVGVVELATTAEATAQTDTVRAVTPAGLADRVLTSRQINTTAPLAGGGDLSATRTLSVATFGTAAAGVVPASGGGTANFLRADGSWNAPWVQITQAAYNALTPPNPNILYVIVG